MTSKAYDRDSEVTDYLNGHPSIEWGDVSRAAAKCNGVLERIVSTPGWLEALLKNLLADGRLQGMCECHDPFDKLVLYDGKDNGLRLRLHLWKKTEFERAHQHRFSFCTRILRGGYRHVIYQAPTMQLDQISVEPSTSSITPENPDPRSAELAAVIEPIVDTFVGEGTTYFLHHSGLHATFPTPGTISLLLRGPAEKERALVADLTGTRVYWRFGRAQEDSARIASKQLSRDAIIKAVSFLCSPERECASL